MPTTSDFLNGQERKCSGRWVMNRMNCIVNEGIIFVVRSVQVDYLRSARFNEQIQVSAEIISVKKASLTFEQIITRGDDVLCTSEIRIACLDANTMRPKAIPENLLELLKNEH